MSFFYLIEVYLNVWNLKINFISVLKNTEQLWNMKSTERVFLFSELVSLWLSTSQNMARQRVKIDRVLGVGGGNKFNMGVA